MAGGRSNGTDRLQQRRWFFADCVFDESNWALFVGSRRVAVELKPLELLRALLLRAGNVVSKEELLDSVWPDVEVVEASLTTAVRKLRGALGEDRRKVAIIETAQRIGYRLAVPVKLEQLDAPPGPLITDMAPEPAEAGPLLPPSVVRQPLAARLMSIAGGLAIVMAALAVAYGPSQQAEATKPASAADQRVPGAQPAFTQRDVETAIREFDIDAVKRMIEAGWDPATPWDKQGNDALTMVLNHCEWDPAHDRRQMLLLARTLIEGGVQVDRRNVWGDTPYSIAKAPRYCGPDHPVTQMLEAMCYGGSMSPRDRCLATYELTAEQRKAQGLPPKG